MSPAERAISYPFAAGTVLTELTPPGYRRGRFVAPIGSSAECFERARREVMAWQLQRRSGIRVLGVDGEDAANVEKGLRAEIRIRLLPGLGIRAGVQVIEVISESNVAGFVYGTLRGHPERGEEAFLVGRKPDGTVETEIRYVSKAAGIFVLGAPIAAVMQRIYTRRYLGALATSSS